MAEDILFPKAVAAMIEFTAEQQGALDQGQSVRVLDPPTRNTYVVVRAETCGHGNAPPAPQEGADPAIPPDVLRAQQAFWQDLPELLKDRRLRGQWVAYSAEGRIGIARDTAELVRACQRRGLSVTACYMDVIEPMPQPPWLLVEDVDLGWAGFGEPDAHPAS